MSQLLSQSYRWSGLKSWFCDLLTSCMRQLKIPKIWRRALVIAIPKPEKPLEDPKSYRPISLLCVPFKILERLIYARVETIIDASLPQEQAGFRHGRSAVDQVTLLTQDIEDSFSAKKKAGAVFVDLTAAYDTVLHRGLTCKLLRLLPDRHMVHVICTGAPYLQHLRLRPASHHLQKGCICRRPSNHAC